MSREFTDTPATREAVPLLIGLVGASGSGKTFSALRLATGMQSVCGGDIFFVDTEARRALWYADKFAFKHVDFKAPFGPLDYLDAIEHCKAKGAKTIIVDSQSHEHEGPGGVLEQHAKTVEEKGQNFNMLAWQKPKGQRRSLLNAILQMPINFIFCFRAKEKMDMRDVKKPKTLGWMPIAGEEFVYEMTVNCLLMPNAGGVPAWHPNEMGEQAIIKLPGQFQATFAKQEPLSEDIGKQLAEWAKGGTPRQSASGDDGKRAAWNVVLASCGNDKPQAETLWKTLTAKHGKDWNSIAASVQ